MPTVHLHGIPRVTAASGADTPLSAREAGLLAWLHLEGPSPRARLAGLLWPGGDESQARANLRQALLRLKRTAGELLEEQSGVLRLAADVTVAPLDAQAGVATPQLLGPLAYDDTPEFAEWLQARRDAAVRARRRGLLADARRHLEAGALDDALAAAEAVLAADGAVEEAHRLRMEVFYLRGDRAAAVTAWDDCRLALRSTYGITPSAATNDLGRLVLAAEAAHHQQADSARALQAAATVLPAALRRPPQLVGRQQALDTLMQALALGHAVVLAGPGGIGKSRLLAHAAAAWEPALHVAGRTGDVHQPGVVIARLLAAAVERHAPVLDAATHADLQRLLPGGADAAPALQSAQEHRRVLAAAARTLRACAERGLRLLAVDDLQHADELSLQALAVVVGDWLSAPAGAAAVPMLGCRPDELSPAGSALLALLGDSTRCTRLDLAPLAVPDIHALLDTLPLQQAGAAALDTAALARALHARVGGNPAYLLESLKALWLDGLQRWQPATPLVVPATLRESLKQRLARLGAPALQLAQLAAVAQDDFSLALAAAALHQPPLALAPLFAELEAAQVLLGVRFSHDLVAEAARAALPAALEAPLHRLVADHLQAHGGAAARIAWHLQQAGAEAEAVPWHLAAAEAARHRWQLADAAHHCEVAAQALERAGRGTVASASIAAIWGHAARWRTATSDYSAALQALERGLGAAPTPAERLELRASQVVVLLNSQRTGEATVLAQALAHDLQAHHAALAPDRLAAALFACVTTAPYAPQPQRLTTLCEDLRAACLAGPPRARQSYHLSVATCLNWQARPLQATPDLEQARLLANDLGDHGLVVNVTHQQLRHALLLGDGERALAAAHDGQQAVQAGGYGSSFQLHALAAQALAAVAAGRPALALSALQALDALLSTLRPGTDAEAEATRAVCWWALGRADRAWPGEPERARTPADGWQAYVHWRACTQPAARQAALAAMARQWPATEGTMGLRRRLLAATVAPPDLAGAEALVAHLREHALWPLARQAHAVAGRSALGAGDRERAVAHARHALALAHAVDPWTDDAASVWLQAAAVLDGAGQAHEAQRALSAGRHWVLQAAATLTSEADRVAWCTGHRVHRTLVGRP